MKGVESYFGIDFGTTNSATVGIEKVDERIRVTRYKDDKYDGPFPSLLAIDKVTGDVFSGREAWIHRRELSESCEIIKSVKSYLGTDKTWKVAGKIWTPELVTASILKGIKEKVNMRYNKDLHEAIISIPVGFLPAKRKSLRVAAEMIGIKVKGFVSESTTAVFKNYETLKKFSKVAVFDWGGGTLDVSIIEIKGREVNELAISGLKLGGDDIDLKLAKWAHTKATTKKNLDISFEEMNPVYQDKIISEAEKAKCSLAYEDSTAITLFKYGEIGAINIQVDIDSFTSLIEPEISEVISTLEDAVKQANISMTELQCILMIGGSSNLRPLHEKVEERWHDKYIELPSDAEWNVAEGSALLSINPGCFKLNQDLGLILSDGSFYPVIKKHDIVSSKGNRLQFGLVEDSDNAIFIFSDNTKGDNIRDLKILGYSNVPVYGFINENVIMESYIDKDLIFRAQMKSNHKPEKNTKEYNFSNLKFYYNLPQMVVEIK